MSHVALRPTILDAASGETLLALVSMFDGVIDWKADDTFSVSFRHYYREGSARALVDRKAGVFTLYRPGGKPSEPQPIARLSEAIDACFTPSEAELAERSAAFWREMREAEAKRRRQDKPLFIVTGLFFAIAILFLLFVKD